MSDSLATNWHPLVNGHFPRWAWSFGEDRSGPLCSIRLGSVEQLLRWIPPGSFWMGSEEQPDSWALKETPRHLVKISNGFWMFDSLCTQDLWKEVLGTHSTSSRGGRHPVGSLSHEDCQTFIARANERIPGLCLRLPTEAEWEYACRAGSEADAYGDVLDAIAWYRDNSDKSAQEVKAKQPNGWGLYDMLGNLWEWCHDGIREYTVDAIRDPMGSTESGISRALRGSSWAIHALDVRASNRLSFAPDVRDVDFGFRCVALQPTESG